MLSLTIKHCGILGDWEFDSRVVSWKFGLHRVMELQIENTQHSIQSIDVI